MYNKYQVRANVEKYLLVAYHMNHIFYHVKSNSGLRKRERVDGVEKKWWVLNVFFNQRELI